MNKSNFLIILCTLFLQTYISVAQDYQLPGYVGRSMRFANQTLSIEGQNIWVRSTPTSGEVILKLNSGDQAKILGSARRELIRGQVHDWLNIDYQGQKGWVFGSQTSIEYYLKTKVWPSLDAAVNSTSFNSNEVEDWEGDPKVVSYKERLEEGNFAVLNFSAPGFMTGKNFSLTGFQTDSGWEMAEFEGNCLKILKMDGMTLAIFIVKSTGGAYTLKNDLIAYKINTKNTLFQVHQEIFEFASGLPDEVSGGIEVEISNDQKTLSIQENIDHNLDDRKGAFAYKFIWSSSAKQFVLQN